MNAVVSPARSSIGVRARTRPTDASTSRWRGVVPVVVLHVALVVVYRTVVTQVYDYEGYRYRVTSLLLLVGPLLLSLVPLLWLPARPTRPSAVVLWLLHVFVVVPTCAITPLNPFRSFGLEVLFAAWVVLCHGLASLALAFPVPERTRVPMAPDVARRTFVVLSTLVLLACVARFGLPTGLVSLGGVYDRRLAFRATLAGAGSVFGYMVGWLTTLIAPFLVVSGVVQRRALPLAVGGFALVWVFLMSGTRQSLVAVPFGALLYWAAARRAKGSAYVLGGLGLLLSTWAAFAVTRKAAFVGAVAERLFAVPGSLGAYYFDFFANGPMSLYRDSFGAIVSPSPFERPITYTIGTVYLNRPEANANVNVFADAFANLWLAGVLVAVGLAVTLWLLDVAAARTRLPAVMASLVLIIISLMNVGLTVALLTNGLLLAIPALWLGGSALFGAADDR